MKNIRYLLAQNNIRPDGEQKRKMAEALLSGKQKNGKKLYKRAGFLSAARVFAVLILSAAVVAAMLFGLNALIKSSDREDDVTTGGDTLAPDTDNGITHIDDPNEMVFFKQQYVSDRTYNILRAALTCSSAPYDGETKNGEYSARKIFVSDPALGLHEPLIEMFSANEDDIDDIIMSIYAFSSSPAITGRYHEVHSVDGGKPYTAIIASYKENTFEYILTLNISIKDDTIYMYDNGEWVDAGRISGYAGESSYTGGSAYPSSDINADKAFLSLFGKRVPYEFYIRKDILKTLTLYKIRVEGGLPVIYDRREIQLSESASGNDTYKLVTSAAHVYREDGNYGVEFNNIISGDKHTVFLPKEYTRTIISENVEYEAMTDTYYFAPPAPEMRADVCRIINELGCEWFFPVSKNGDNYTGVPIYYNKSTRKLTDFAGGTVAVYFDPESSAVPLFDLNRCNLELAIVRINRSSGNADVHILDAFYLDNLNSFYVEYYEKYGEAPINKYDCPMITERFSLAGFTSSSSYYSPDALERGLRYGLTGDLDVALIQSIESGYKRFEKEFGVEFDAAKESFDYYISTNASAVMPELYGGGTRTYRPTMMSLNFMPFNLTGTSGKTYIKSSEKTYSVTEIRGYRVLDNGFAVDFQGRIIGYLNGMIAYDNGDVYTDMIFSTENLPPLYMVCDGSAVVYIGTVMPFSNFSGKTVFPFEKVNDTLLYESEILLYFGPFFIINSTRTDEYLHTNFTIENPEFSDVSYLHYENGRYNRITIGKYGDKYIRNIGNTAYTLELTGASRPIIKTYVYIHLSSKNTGNAYNYYIK